MSNLTTLGSSPLIQEDFRDLFSGKIQPFVEPFVYFVQSSPGSTVLYPHFLFTFDCKEGRSDGTGFLSDRGRSLFLPRTR
jgi:hypothetical protein